MPKEKQETKKAQKEFQKKLTPRTIGLDVETCEEIVKGKGNKSIIIGRFHGIIKGYEMKDDSQFDPYPLFTGDFQAMNAITRKKYRSEKLILPQVASMFLQHDFEGAKENGKPTALAFALNITIKENISKKGGTKFSWGVEPLKGNNKADLLDKIDDELDSEFGEVPALTAPAA